ncbi:hypothetical protein KXV98_002597 [Aspergillus fumigatus]|nr:hypothetical protein KXX29_002889 [Aspergillus fumigatus]KAH1575109.1 hypothetical protein KXX17_008551 [Aspergillus fumigatus]KAH1659221.1 hypothetical protein KXX46_007670 [Aspergillus fumigatus]KAH2364710.1 hypothetical protein KXV98_002597 [Aspergillus fumigatus]KAH3045561.1 hypothetical protein KXV27_005354 [Aspergillus fumigatus]
MASPERQIENLTKRVETLARIITANSLNYICPQCFCGFSEQRLLYRHFDKEKQNCPVHAALGERRSDHLAFVMNYKIALRTLIDAKDIPPNPRCFALDFVVEHFGEHP